MRSFALVAVSFVALLGCSEVEVDTGRACVIPAEATCSDCFNPPFTICSFEPTEEGDEDWVDTCTPGELPADSALQIEVNFGPGQGDSSDLECNVEQTAERELVIHASYRWRNDGDADAEPNLYVACQTPPLAAGSWTIHYGQNRRTIEVGESASVTCIDSGSR